MKKRLLILTALALAIVASPAALAGSKGGEPNAREAAKTVHVKLLGLNDFHGHLEAPTGRASGSATRPAESASRSRRPGERVLLDARAGAWLRRRRTRVRRRAGDLVGASPLISALFHDESTIDVMNQIGLDEIGVGNHEFDEGESELLRLQYGDRKSHGGDGTKYKPVRPDGCHPIDGCQDGTPFSGSVFQYLAANVIDTDTDNPLLPEYEIVDVGKGQKIAFIGETLQGTPLIVTPAGVAGLSFLDEANTVNALVPRLKKKNVSAIVLLLHQGGFQNPPYSRGFQDVDKCENFSGPELLDIVNRLSPDVDVVVSAHTHAAYNCVINGIPVTSAASFGRLITSIDLTIDQKRDEVTEVAAQNHVVTQTVPKDPAISAIIAHYKTYSDGISNRVIGRITADIYSARGVVNGTNRAGEQPMGDVIADGMLEATARPTTAAPWRRS